jgi:hypothetical protein
MLNNQRVYQKKREAYGSDGWKYGVIKCYKAEEGLLLGPFQDS